MGHTVTLVDVAKEAGVSTATAGRVVGGYCNVSEVKRERVLKAAKDLGYTPNHTAQALKCGSTKTLAIAVGCLDLNYTTQLVDSVDTAARKRGYGLLICNTHDDPAVERDYLRKMQARHVDGMIVMASGHPTEALKEEYRELVDSGMRLVGMDRPIPGVEGRIIQTDNEKASYEAMKYLLDLGHRRIAIVASREGDSWSDDRVEGARRALAEKGLTLDENLITRGNCADLETVVPRTGEILDTQHPTALYVLFCNPMEGIIGELRKRKMHYPDDISVLVWDDAGFNDLMGLSSVDQRLDEFGRLAVDRILDSEGPQERTDLLDGAVTERGSCAPPRGAVGSEQADVQHVSA